MNCLDHFVIWSARLEDILIAGNKRDYFPYTECLASTSFSFLVIVRWSSTFRRWSKHEKTTRPKIPIFRKTAEQRWRRRWGSGSVWLMMMLSHGDAAPFPLHDKRPPSDPFEGALEGKPFIFRWNSRLLVFSRGWSFNRTKGGQAGVNNPWTKPAVAWLLISESETSDKRYRARMLHHFLLQVQRYSCWESRNFQDGNCISE